MKTLLAKSAYTIYQIHEDLEQGKKAEVGRNLARHRFSNSRSPQAGGLTYKSLLGFPGRESRDTPARQFIHLSLISWRFMVTAYQRV
jgi:hypothetical protein